MSVKKGIAQVAYDRPASEDTEDQELRTASGRELIAENGVANNSIEKIVEGVIGRGLNVQSKPDVVRLKITQKQASEWSKLVEAEFRAYARTTRIDLEEMLNLDQLAAVFFREQLIAGDGLALDYWEVRQNTKWRTCIRLIDSNLLRNPVGSSETDRFHQGIEIDSKGRVKKYHFRKRHQNATLQNSDKEKNEFESESVNKYSANGRRLKVYHGFYKRRPGSYRGIGALTSVLQQFKCLREYQAAELDAAVANALVAAVVKSNASFEDVLNAIGAETDNDEKLTEWLDLRPKKRKLESGKILNLIPGEEFDSHSPGRPNAVYTQFVQTIIREIGVSLQVPYEVLMSDFSNSNYSSTRAAFLQAWRSFTIRREQLVFSFYAPVYQNWLDEAITRGVIPAPGYTEDPTLWNGSLWQSDGYGVIDPQKEALAAETRLRNGSTMQHEFAERGQDWETVLEQKAREKAKMQELGLTAADINPQLLGQGMQDTQESADEQNEENE